MNIVLSLPLKLLLLVKVLNIYQLQKFKKSGETAVPCSSVEEESNLLTYDTMSIGK
jgi:hypothetical protein